MAQYTITQIPATPTEYVLNNNNGFVAQYSTLAATLSYLAGVMVAGDSVIYIVEPAASGQQ